MSEDEAKTHSEEEEEEEEKATPKKGKGRGRPKKAGGSAAATPASAEAAEEDIVAGAPLLLHQSTPAAPPTRNEDEEPTKEAHTPERWHTPIELQTTFVQETAEQSDQQFPQEPQLVPEFPTEQPPVAKEEAPIESEFKVPPLPVVSDTPPFLPFPQFSAAALSPSTDLQFADLLGHQLPPPPQQDNHQFVTNIEIDTADDDQFQPAQNFQFAASDFDFLLSKGGGGQDQAVEVPRDSLLLKFDPLLKATPLIQHSQQRLSVTREETPEEVGTGELQELPDFVEGVVNISTDSSNPLPPIIIETAPAAEDGEGKSPDPQEQQESSAAVGELGAGACGGGVLLTGLETSGFIAIATAAAAAVSPSTTSATDDDDDVSMNVDEEAKNPQPHCADDEEADEKMSVDNTMILDGGESSSSLAERNESYMEADQDFNGPGVISLNNSANNELTDKKSKNESLKIEELQKKLSEAELREDALLKRITEKDKTISKMSGVVEAYERAIADLITQKEQTTQSYEKTCEALKADSDINAQHLESLEKTFSDLHAKYERMKVSTDEYKVREEELMNERNRLEESLKMQEKRYENMKSHAMTQLDIANNKLADLVRNHAQEVTKLKALLKKEEIYRASVNEQLSQKSRENEELVKICEELINGGAN